METIKKQFTYGEIVAVGRKLRRYESILNNAEQFREAFWFEFQDDLMSDHFEKINEFLVKKVAKYTAIYNNMIKTINS